MNLTPNSKVLIQGITEPLSSTYAAQMKAYGTNIVAGVSPGQSGQMVHNVPVFDLVEEALSVVGPVDTTMIFVPPYQALDAALEAVVAGIQQLVVISAGVPPLDMVHLLRKVEATETLVVGPNSAGIIVPGKILLGTHASEFYTPGPVGILSSSTLTYEIALELTKSGVGQSISVSIGSDAITGSSFLQWLQILDEDESTQVIVLVGEPGNKNEEAAARYIAEAIDKPVIAYVAGRYAVGKHSDHASTLATVVGKRADIDTAQSKIAAFKEANIPIAELPSQIPELVKNALKKKV